MSAEHAVDVRVTGRVQGVFFRARCREEAGRLGVSGWARNDDDGSVRAHFEGAREDVDRLVDWCRTGPPAADVAGVEVTASEVTGDSGFLTG